LGALVPPCPSSPDSGTVIPRQKSCRNPRTRGDIRILCPSRRRLHTDMDLVVGPRGLGGLVSHDRLYGPCSGPCEDADIKDDLPKRAECCPRFRSRLRRSWLWRRLRCYLVKIAGRAHYRQGEGTRGLSPANCFLITAVAPHRCEIWGHHQPLPLAIPDPDRVLLAILAILTPLHVKNRRICASTPH
jgi:hypothetical protein